MELNFYFGRNPHESFVDNSSYINDFLDFELKLSSR